jgi:hypothetical protein
VSTLGLLFSFACHLPNYPNGKRSWFRQTFNRTIHCSCRLHGPLCLDGGVSLSCVVCTSGDTPIVSGIWVHTKLAMPLTQCLQIYSNLFLLMVQALVSRILVPGTRNFVNVLVRRVNCILCFTRCYKRRLSLTRSRFCTQSEPAVKLSKRVICQMPSPLPRFMWPKQQYR